MARAARVLLPVEYWGPQKEGRVIPEPVHRVLRELGGAKFEVDVVHPVDYEDGRVAFVMVKGDETYLFRYEPPDTARVMFLDELKGGRYEETFIRTEDDGYWIKGLFDHPRLDDDGPLTDQPQPMGGWPMPLPRHNTGVRANCTSSPAKFREWSKAFPPPQPSSPS